jgi:O-antigen/teichoic acid export membrane protein
MKILTRLGINSLWLIAARLGTQVGMVLFTILLARKLGSSAFGGYAFIAALIMIGNVFTTFGTDMLLIRDIAATDELASLSPALIIQMVLSLLFIGIVFLASSFMTNVDKDTVIALQIYSLSLLPLAFYTVYSTALRGKQRMGTFTVLNLLLILLQVCAALWLVWKGGNLITLAILLLIVQTLSAGLAGIICSRQIRGLRLSWQFPIKQIRSLLQASAPIALLSLLGILYQRLNLVMLPALGGAEITGWYSAAARVIEAAKIGHVAVFTAIYPLMAQFNAVDKSKLSKTFRLPWFLLLGGAVFSSFAIVLLSKPIVSFAFGLEYTPSISILQILAWMLVPYTINTFLSLAFLAQGNEGIVTGALTMGIIVLAALTIWWEPTAGARGAAWAALTAEIVQSIILVTQDTRQHHVLSAGGLNEFSKFS